MGKGACMFCHLDGEGFGSGAICRSCASKAKLTLDGEITKDGGWTMVYAVIGRQRRLVQEFKFTDIGNISLVAAAAEVGLRSIARGQKADGGAADDATGASA